MNRHFEDFDLIVIPVKRKTKRIRGYARDNERRDQDYVWRAQI